MNGGDATGSPLTAPGLTARPGLAARRPDRPPPGPAPAVAGSGVERAPVIGEDMAMTTSSAASPVTDPRATVEYRISAAELLPGDLVNTSPGADDDWQQVLGVYSTSEQLTNASGEVKTLVESLDGRYVVVELTDIAPVDANVYFADDGTAMAAGVDDDADQAIVDLASPEDGRRTYLYTKFELVTVRSHG
jgi:hypothetical protein